jgi:hypothetical protein
VADEIVINVDTGRCRDGTLDLLRMMASRRPELLPHGPVLRVIPSRWTWTPSGGEELARQTNIAIEACRGTWVLSVQADEVLHEDDTEIIRWITGLPEAYAGAEVMRLYFWRDPQTLRTDWTQRLVRMIRRGRGRAVGDAMALEADGLVWPADDGIPRLYHYSRLGTPEEIGRRLRNLDSLFHRDEELDCERPYDFVLREVDSHLKPEYRTPKTVDSSVLQPYCGTHPKVMQDWWASQRISGADEGDPQHGDAATAL